MDYLSRIFDKFYWNNPKLLAIILRHSEDVSNKALEICRKHPELGADESFVYNAAMLHDIGIVKCNAPGIECYGSEPYIRHGILGGEMLRQEGLDLYARVAERHTGTGLTINQIISQNLPLPHQDFSPETIEEQIICYADKFFSKSNLDRVKTPEQVQVSMQKFGEESVARFIKWESLFE